MPLHVVCQTIRYKCHCMLTSNTFQYELLLHLQAIKAITWSSNLGWWSVPLHESILNIIICTFEESLHSSKVATLDTFSLIVETHSNKWSLMCIVRKYTVQSYTAYSRVSLTALNAAYSQVTVHNHRIIKC